VTPTEIRNTVRTLRAQGHSLREISRLLALSRNTVRRILRAPAGNVAETPSCDEATPGRRKKPPSHAPAANCITIRLKNRHG
jgi:DNA invertase Pin-like site-specific DNA recombinase